MSHDTFQPFTDRLSRDIRNELSESFMDVLAQGGLAPAEKVAHSFLQQDLAPCYKEYIRLRLAAYARILENLDSNNDDPLYIGLLLWDEGLFFEVHEVLEHAWLGQKGAEKLFLQAMIRAAGVYIKVESGQIDAAGRLAQKALPIIIENRKRLDGYASADSLITGLQDIMTPPPKFLRSHDS